MLVIAGLVGWWLYERQQRLNDEAIDNYDKCVAAGYPIIETYPEQCRTDDGRNFTRDISDELAMYEFTSEKGVKIQINTPTANEIVAAPFRVVGQVPGSWTFEGSFPLTIVDEDGEVLTTKSVTVNGEWTTDALVPFDTEVSVKNYDGPATIILHRDNPSDLPENDDSVRIDVTINTNS